MINDDLSFKWMKIKNGRLHLAVLSLDIQKNNVKNEIIENYSGNGYSDHSVDVGSEGMETWKKGLTKGLEFVLSNSLDYWTITINRLEGRPVMDTNPTIIGYTGILCVLDKTDIIIDQEKLESIENLVYQSWGDNQDKIPNFNELIFE